MQELPPFLFIRHGETDWNRELRLQGQTDIPLNTVGRSQAARNGRALAPLLADGEWKRVASPLGRTRHTMEIALAEAGREGADYACDDRLKEVSFGAWEGFTIDELSATSADATAAREADKWNFVPPDGESYAMLAGRVRGWLEHLDAPTLVVAHGGVMRVLLHLTTGVPAAQAPTLPTPQDKVLLFADRSVEYY